MRHVVRNERRGHCARAAPRLWFQPWNFWSVCFVCECVCVSVSIRLICVFNMVLSIGSPHVATAPCSVHGCTVRVAQGSFPRCTTVRMSAARSDLFGFIFRVSRLTISCQLVARKRAAKLAKGHFSIVQGETFTAQFENQLRCSSFQYDFFGVCISSCLTVSRFFKGQDG